MDSFEIYEPELGQMAFGQPYKKYGVPQFLHDALDAISGVMQINKTCGDYTPFSNSGATYKNDVFEANTYDWSECNCDNCFDDGWTQDKCTCGWKPQEYNFKWKDIEVSWYKHSNRGATVNRVVTHQEVKQMLKECLSSLLK